MRCCSHKSHGKLASTTPNCNLRCLCAVDSQLWRSAINFPTISAILPVYAAIWCTSCRRWHPRRRQHNIFCLSDMATHSTRPGRQWIILLLDDWWLINVFWRAHEGRMTNSLRSARVSLSHSPWERGFLALIYYISVRPPHLWWHSWIQIESPLSDFSRKIGLAMTNGQSSSPPL